MLTYVGMYIYTQMKKSSDKQLNSVIPRRKLSNNNLKNDHQLHHYSMELY
jgi:hypothetical protein